MQLLCDRPHPKVVDYDGSRFVVAAPAGLAFAGGLRLQRGDELPRGTLTARFLRLEYEAHHIELATYAATVPSLCEACAQRGVDLAPVALRPSAPRRGISDELEALTRKELSGLAMKYGVSDGGSKADIIQRLVPLVG